MPEGVSAASGKIVGTAVYDNPKLKPDPDPVTAPYGWTWDRDTRNYRPKKRTGRAGFKGVGGGPGMPPPDAPDSPPVNSGPKQDPDPSWFGEAASGDPRAGKKRFSINDVPQGTVNDIAGFMGLVGTPILAMLQQIDPYCGTALAQSFEPIVDATLPLICRSERIVNYFKADENDWLLWGKLALALRPVGQAILQHHVFKTVQVVRDEHGIPMVVQVQRGGSDHGDHVQPPVQPEFNYAV